ncbi:hypothetical protein Tco_0110255 [Tanacetum coccineum]
MEISKEDLTNTCFSSGFQLAFLSLFGEEIEYFAPRLFFNMDKLEKKLNKEEFNEEIAMVVFKVFKNQFWQFINNQIFMDYDDQMANKFFIEYTLCDAQLFQNILINKMDSVEKAIIKRGLYKRAHDSRARRGTKSEKENESSRSGNDTRAEGVDIRLSNEPEPMNETYKDLFESIQSSRVETNQCDKVKIKFDMDKIETQNIELEHQVASLIKENEHLKLVYKNFFDSIKKPRVQKENLRSMSEFAIDHILGKDDSSSSSIAESNISKIEKESGKNICKSAKSKFEAYFEKLENTKFVLERQLARKVDDSKAEKDQCLKEINHLRTQLENLKGKSVETKFDKPSILGNPPADKLLITSKLSNSRFTPKVVVQKDLSKPVTAQSLPRNEKDQLLKRITSLESKLASQDLRSFQKRIP